MKAALAVGVVVMLVVIQTLFLRQHLHHLVGIFLLPSSQPISSISNRTELVDNEMTTNNSVTYIAGEKQQQQLDSMSNASHRAVSLMVTNTTETIQRKNFESAHNLPQKSHPITHNKRRYPIKRKTKRIRKIVAKAATINPNIQSGIQVQPGDFIYDTTRWDAAPIVLEEFNLVFFTVPKVGCTVWKQLFRRMMGYKNWRVQMIRPNFPHHPDFNGLKYLHHYSLEDATHFMTSPNFTRAIFVRDPKERFLSAYLDKALRKNGLFVKKFCLPSNNRLWVKKEFQSISGFLQVVKTCNNDHWNPQAHRVDERFWPYINFVGHMETIGMNARRLLEQVGAWERFGKNDWGPYQNESIFHTHSDVHTTGAAGKLERYITTRELEKQIDEFYADDYASPWLNLTKRSIPSLHNADTNQAVIG